MLALSQRKGPKVASQACDERDLAVRNPPEESPYPSILVVDDEAQVRTLLSRVLERGGYKTLIRASSAAEAREVLASKSVDLVLTDMQMPGGSGLDLLTYVHSSMPHIATLMVTGVDDTELADKALEMGAYGYIVKPFNKTEVLVNINNALRRRDLEKENEARRSQLEGLVQARTSELWETITKLEMAEKDVRSSRTETIQRLAIAAEYRDEETGRHVARMSQYSEVLARAAEVAPELQSSIREAASLHDVGKIGIPDSILLKPTTLTDEERSVMQQHAMIGHRILADSDSPLLSLASSIALSHHEKVDGTGYPNRLTSDAIPVEARIAAIADVFDALTTNRVYRRAYPVGVAVEMMKSESGAHFDAELLACFWSCLPDVLNIKEENAPAGLSEKRPRGPEHIEWEELR